MDQFIKETLRITISKGSERWLGSIISMKEAGDMVRWMGLERAHGSVKKKSFYKLTKVSTTMD